MVTNEKGQKQEIEAEVVNRFWEFFSCGAPMIIKPNEDGSKLLVEVDMKVLLDFCFKAVGMMRKDFLSKESEKTEIPRLKDGSALVAKAAGMYLERELSKQLLKKII